MFLETSCPEKSFTNNYRAYQEKKKTRLGKTLKAYTNFVTRAVTGTTIILA